VKGEYKRKNFVHGQTLTMPGKDGQPNETALEPQESDEDICIDMQDDGE